MVFRNYTRFDEFFFFWWMVGKASAKRAENRIWREESCLALGATWTEVGMARGIPRPSILEVPDLFSLLDSPRNRFYHSSAPRILAKIFRGPWNTEFPLSMRILENFQKFVEILLFLYLLFSISSWYYYPTLKYKINADFFEFFPKFIWIFVGIFRIF